MSVLLNLSKLLLTFVACYLGPACAKNLAAAQAADSRPNILWITCEDMSPDLGCYGDKQAWTPHIDRLAAEGTRFANAYSVAPVCAPSRSAIITGMYPTEIGTMHMRSKAVPPAHLRCFTEYLRAAGYYCTNNVKTDYNFNSPRTAWDQNSKKAHWRNRPSGKPFFSVFNITITHESKFHLSDEEFERVVTAVPAEKRHRPGDAELPPYYPDTPITRKDWARYQDMITAMDLEVGRILGELEEDGLSSNTIVFYYSDHGRGLPRGKRWLYDSGLRTPLLVRWPGQLAPGGVNQELVSFIDFAPTVLALAGVPIPEYMDGRVLVGDGKQTEPKYVFAARDRMDEVPDTIRAVRDRRYKFIRNIHPEKPYAQVIEYGEKTPTMQEWRRLHSLGKLTASEALFFRKTKPAEELYDTEADPHELKNLADKPEYAVVRKQMEEALDQWLRETSDLGLIPEEELQEKMRPGGKWMKTEAPVFRVTAVGSEKGKRTVELSSPTEGASIAYQKDGADRKSEWRLYSRPFTVDQATTVSAVACRLGYHDSDVVSRQITDEKK